VKTPQKEGLATYVRYLYRFSSFYKKKGSGRDLFPNLHLVTRALTIEETLDFKQVERDRVELAERLTRNLSKEQLDVLIQCSLQHRTGQLGYGDYHRYLKTLCRSSGIALEQWKQLSDYITYVMMADRIDRNALLDELTNMEETVQNGLCRTAEQRNLVALSRRLSLLEKLSAHEMTPADWTTYEKDRPGILSLPLNQKQIPPHPPFQRGDLEALETGPTVAPPLSSVVQDFASLLAPFESFCRTAVTRNEAFVDNLLVQAKQQNARVAVLIAGGFHSEGLTEIFRKRDISWVVATPRITEIPKDANYLDVFARDPLPLDKLFSGEKIFLNYARLTSRVPIAGGAEVVRPFVLRYFTYVALLTALKNAGSNLKDIATRAGLAARVLGVELSLSMSREQGDVLFAADTGDDGIPDIEGTVTANQSHGAGGITVGKASIHNARVTPSAFAPARDPEQKFIKESSQAKGRRWMPWVVAGTGILTGIVSHSWLIAVALIPMGIGYRVALVKGWTGVVKTTDILTSVLPFMAPSMEFNVLQTQTGRREWASQHSTQNAKMLLVAAETFLRSQRFGERWWVAGGLAGLLAGWSVMNLLEILAPGVIPAGLLWDLSATTAILVFFKGGFFSRPVGWLFHTLTHSYNNIGHFLGEKGVHLPWLPVHPVLATSAGPDNDPFKDKKKNLILNGFPMGKEFSNRMDDIFTRLGEKDGFTLINELVQHNLIQFPEDLDLDRHWSAAAHLLRLLSSSPDKGAYRFMFQTGYPIPRAQNVVRTTFYRHLATTSEGFHNPLMKSLAFFYYIQSQSGKSRNPDYASDVFSLIKTLERNIQDTYGITETDPAYEGITKAVDEMLNHPAYYENKFEQFVINKLNRLKRLNELNAIKLLIDTDMEQLIQLLLPAVPAENLRRIREAKHPDGLEGTMPFTLLGNPIDYSQWTDEILSNGDPRADRGFTRLFFPPATFLNTAESIEESQLRRFGAFFHCSSQEKRREIARNIINNINKQGLRDDYVPYVAAHYWELAPLAEPLRDSEAISSLYFYWATRFLQDAFEYRRDYDGKMGQAQVQYSALKRDRSRDAISQFFVQNSSKHCLTRAIGYWHDQKSPGAPPKKSAKKALEPGTKIPLISDTEQEVLLKIIKHLSLDDPQRDLLACLHDFILFMVERRYQREEDPVVQFMSEILTRMNIDPVAEQGTIRTFLVFVYAFSFLPKEIQKSSIAKLRKTIHAGVSGNLSQSKLSDQDYRKLQNTLIDIIRGNLPTETPRLTSIHFADGGNAMTNYPDLIKYTFKFLPPLRPVRPKGLPKKTKVDRTTISVVSILDTLNASVDFATPTAVFGRTLTYKTGSKSIQLKFLKQGEDPSLLAYEYDMFDFFRTHRDIWGLRGSYPMGRTRLGRISTNLLPEGIFTTEQGKDGPISVDITDGFYTFMAYETELSPDARNDYYTYLNDHDLNADEFMKGFEINVHDRFVMASHGIFDMEIIELFHNQEHQQHRRYDWMVDVKHHQKTRAGAGRLNDIIGATLYPNIRLSGPADLAAVAFIDDLIGDPEIRHLSDDRIRRLLNMDEVHRNESLVRNYVTAALLGDTLLSLSLIPPTYLLRRGELSYETESGNHETFLQKAMQTLFELAENSYGSITGLSTGIDLPIDFQLMARQMAYFMTDAYVSQNETSAKKIRPVPEDLYPGSAVTYGPMNRGMTPDGWNVRGQTHRPPSRGVTTEPIQSRDLGPVNGPNPLQTLIQALYTTTVSMVAEQALGLPDNHGGTLSEVATGSENRETPAPPAFIFNFLFSREFMARHPWVYGSLAVLGAVLETKLLYVLAFDPLGISVLTYVLIGMAFALTHPDAGIALVRGWGRNAGLAITAFMRTTLWRFVLGVGFVWLIQHSATAVVLPLFGSVPLMSGLAHVVVNVVLVILVVRDIRNKGEALRAQQAEEHRLLILVRSLMGGKATRVDWDVQRHVDSTFVDRSFDFLRRSRGATDSLARVERQAQIDGANQSQFRQTLFRWAVEAVCRLLGITSFVGRKEARFLVAQDYFTMDEEHRALRTEWGMIFAALNKEVASGTAGPGLILIGVSTSPDAMATQISEFFKLFRNLRNHVHFVESGVTDGKMTVEPAVFLAQRKRATSMNAVYFKDGVGVTVPPELQVYVQTKELSLGDIVQMALEILAHVLAQA